MMILNLVFEKILKQLKNEECPCCKSTVLQHTNKRFLRCTECGWGLTINIEEPEPEKLKALQRKRLKEKDDDDRKVDLNGISFDRKSKGDGNDFDR